MEVLKLKRNLTKSKQNGFSFIEVLISVTILALVIVGVLTMTTVHIKTNNFALHHTKAVQLAEEGVERMMRMDFDTVFALNGSPQVEAYDTIPKYAEFTRTISVTQVDMDNVTIACRVRWKTQGLNSNPVTMQVFRTK
jgi:prepilin-type N-terminal cleavage/methylation domain-containing protein